MVRKIRHALGGLGLVLAAILAVALCPTPPAWAAEVTLTSETTTWTDGNTYVASGNVTINERVTTEGNVVLLLKDGCTFTINGGIFVDTNLTSGIQKLTIKGESSESAMGKLIVQNATKGNAGIEPKSGELYIEGGSVTAKGGENAAGIGSGQSRSCNSISITGGSVIANGGEYGAGIGSGQYGSCDSISITGGSVIANSGREAAGIGSGSDGKCDSISITGGSVTANGGSYGAGIGNGYRGSCSSISITGGSVTANGGSYGAGIGSGNKGSCSSISITGGTVTANGGSYGAGIGSGNQGKCTTVSINGGTVTATGGTGYGTTIEITFGGAGIGSGLNGSSNSISITGGFVAATGGDKSAGIGSGYKAGCEQVSISDNSVVIATGGSGAQNNIGLGEESTTLSGTTQITGGIVFEGENGKVYGNTVTPTDSLTIPSGKTLNIESGQTLTIDSGKTLTVAGGGKVDVKGEGKVEVGSGGTLVIGNGGTATVEQNGTLANNGVISRMQGGTLDTSATSGTSSDNSYYAIIIVGDEYCDMSDIAQATYGALVLPSFTRAGYMLSWLLEGSSTTYAAGTTVEPATSGDITFKATWTADVSVISFDSNGGSRASAVEGVTDGTVGDRTMPRTYRYSYMFMGWYDNPEFTGEAVEQLPETFPAGGVIYYAKWRYYHIHTPQSVAAVAPTCTEPGLTEGSICATCDKVLKAQEEVAALGHEWGEWAVTKPATVFEEGEETCCCTHVGCSAVQARSIAKLDTVAVTVGDVTYSFDGVSLTVTAFAKGKARVTVHAKVKIDGAYYKVTGIQAGALDGCKATTLLVKCKSLTKASIKGCLKGSKIKTVTIRVGTVKANKSYVKKCKGFFVKGNCGKKVTLKASTRALK